jgi:DNA polymerase
VVGDCFIGTLSEKGQVWGKEEDAMLWRMMQAIGLDQRSVYVTNAIKCPQPGPVQLGSLMEKSCFPHLEKEIQIIRPQLICAMGDSVTRALLKTKAPLARLRGRFRSYRSPQGNVIKIMPTYHPRLLLQHPEMKQATWKDLQAVQRMLLASSHAV